MDWEQSLVNAQVEVNRAVFEHNKPGECPPELIDIEYVKFHIREAIKDLQAALADIENVIKFEDYADFKA